ncbi:unnamed protein product [Lampetra planeri]
MLLARGEVAAAPCALSPTRRVGCGAAMSFRRWTAVGCMRSAPARRGALPQLSPRLHPPGLSRPIPQQSLL